MFQQTTGSIIVALVLLIVVCLNASLLLNGLIRLSGSPSTDPVVKRIKTILLGLVVANFMLALFMIVAVTLLFVYKGKLSAGGSNKFLDALLIIGGISVLGNGIVCAWISSRLHCLRADLHIDDTWKMTTSCTVISIVGAVAALAVQGFLVSKVDEALRKIIGGTSAQMPGKAFMNPYA